ncbi:copper homeostasis protein CutC [Paenibacillus sp. N1-5-1-14]|uniref:copper homeostasis protein CutC n=1 Tax=Paenibacillus radicibacter TaxID=2972488 RepID=UPI002158AFF6|nr:copper homeostasis protein CutC [Paenibacillus radicibacter]MCR8644723.1 copper homeostasis protein CutC [Paenibacillus radicibacter]
MLLEVIGTTLSEVKQIAASGADRIELITGIAEGGLTPSIALIEEAAHAVSIPIQVMVRPHSRSFCYDADDLRVMERDIEAIRKVGRSGVGVVLGTLTTNGQIDHYALERLLSAAGDIGVTFHRAFDEIEDQESAYDQLSKYPQIYRILTSGGQANVRHAVPRMKRLVKLSRDSHVRILAGSGLNIDSLQTFIQETGVQEVHFGSGVRGAKGSLDEIDSMKIQTVKAHLAQIQ